MPELKAGPSFMWIDSTGFSASTTPPLVPHSGTANTKGSWTELFSSVAYDSYFMVVRPVGIQTNASSQWLMDIGVGSAGSEQVVIPNLMICGDSVERPGNPIYLPMYIPKGSRISGRSQRDGNNQKAPAISINLYGGSVGAEGLFSQCTDYGTDESDSGGLVIDPGSSSNTEGVWTELSASTAHDIRHGVVAFSYRGNTSIQTYRFLFDVAVGAASSEIIVMENLAVQTTISETLHGTYTSFPIFIPAGSRLSMRGQCEGTGSQDRLLDAAFYGFN